MFNFVNTVNIIKICGLNFSFFNADKMKKDLK